MQIPKLQSNALDIKILLDKYVGKIDQLKSTRIVRKSNIYIPVRASQGKNWNV